MSVADAIQDMQLLDFKNVGVSTYVCGECMMWAGGGSKQTQLHGPFPLPVSINIHFSLQSMQALFVIPMHRGYTSIWPIYTLQASLKI